MPRQQVTTDLAPSPAGPYSQAITANGFLFTAGQTPHDPATGDTVGTTIEEQTLQAMKNLAAVLAGHGLDFSHVVKATVHLHHPGRDFAGFNATYEEFVEAPTRHEPRWVRSWATSSSKSTPSQPYPNHSRNSAEE
jgi:2-iminobutanoate/2-iminopropanoate deaminase